MGVQFLVSHHHPQFVKYTILLTPMYFPPWHSFSPAYFASLFLVVLKTQMWRVAVSTHPHLALTTRYIPYHDVYILIVFLARLCTVAANKNAPIFQICRV